MKKIKSCLYILTCLSIFITTLKAQSFNNDELFRTKKGKTLKIYRKIPILRGADIKGFKESYQSSRRDLRRELIGDAMDLMDMGAKGVEALFIVKEFDKMITDRRNAAHKNFGLSLEGFIKSRVNSLYNRFLPKKRRLDFKYLNSGLDMFMYGTYSTSSRVAGGIILNLTVVNISTNIERSFIGEGSPVNAVNQAIGKLFHEFHKTRFPAEFNLGVDGMITLLKKVRVKGGYTTSIRANHNEAKEYCRSLDGRLTSRKELNLLQRAGGYNGGIFIGEAGEDYFWGISGDKVYISYERRVTSIFSISGSKYFNYICVK